MEKRTPRHVPLLSAMLCGLLTAAGWAQPSGAQVAAPGEPPEGAPVHAVRFEGLERVSETFCRSRLTVKPPQPFSADRLAEDARRLLRTGKFVDVQTRLHFENGQLIVTFSVRERSVIASIDFVGNKKYSDRRLRKKIDLDVGEPMNRFAVQQAGDAIAQTYKDAGYADVQVLIDENLLRAEQRLVFNIEEGSRVRVKKIKFEGNEAFADKLLKPKITTKRHIPIFRTGDFNPDRAESDAAAIQNFYRDQGYLDARVSYRSESTGSGGDLILTYIIEEASLYTAEEISFEGNRAFTRDELQAMIRLEPDNTMRRDFLEKDLATLKEEYGRIGYLDATVTATHVFTEQPGVVRLTFDVAEGNQFTVGRIVVRGNEQTQDKVVRRELDFYPEDFFDTTKIKQSEQNLRSTGLFSFSKITPVGDQPNVRDVLVDVTESDQTNRFLLGGGVGSNSGLGATFSYESRNFDISDWPRSWSEFIRFRAFKGAGQYFRLELAPGSDLSAFRIDFREPYLFDKRLRLGTSLYLFQRNREDYDEQRLGANLSFRKYFEDGFLKEWSGEISFRLEDVEIDDLEDFPADDILDAEGHSVLTAAKVLFLRNRTDSRFFPTKGDVWNISYEQAVGDHTFAKIQVGYTWYKTIKIDEFDRASVLALKGEAGYIFGNAPVFERFYAGGIGSLRGFRFRGISPRDGPFFDDDQRIGGSFRLLTGAEYSFPLWAEKMRGLLFTDMGTVEEGLELTSWRASIGVGMRIYLDLFGPVPLEFNLAFPAASDGHDDLQAFSFAIGLTF